MFERSFRELRALVDSNMDAVRLACELEATAPKLGNVHPAASFDDCDFEDFVAAARMIAPILADQDSRLGLKRGLTLSGKAENTGKIELPPKGQTPFQTEPSTRLGKRILNAVIATKSVTSANVNLGIILLVAPLAISRSIDDVQRRLDSLTEDDGRDVFEAIRLASPGGMKRDDVAANEDVQSSIIGPIDLIAAMRHAADRDRIALQYATGFDDFFHVILPVVEKAMHEAATATTAVVNAQLQLMAKVKDTLIARKCGEAVALEAMERADECLRHDSNEVRAEFDAWLRADGNRRNPGTTADLIAASLYWLLRPQTNTF